MIDSLVEKFARKEAVVGIVGLGYVGLPLLLRYAEAGFQVVGFDVDPVKVNKILCGESYLRHIPADRISAASIGNKIGVTTDFARAAEVDALLICVPTPLGSHHEPDLSFVVTTIDELLPFLHQGQIVSLESTTYPGTTDELIKPRLEERSFVVGEDIFLVYSPEREDPGNVDFSTRTIPKVYGGDTDNCRKAGHALYGQVIDQLVPVSSTQAAEMTKLLENIYRAVNIGLVNELKMVADRMNIDIREVIDAAATKPFGFTPFYPGPGLGGHCIPIDPFYLTWKAREFGLHTRFIELAGEVNTTMPEWVVGKVADSLNDQSKPLRGAKILVLGIAYKKNVDDLRESPAVVLLDLLQQKGAEVSYSDPHVPSFPKIRKFSFTLDSVALSRETLQGVDCVIIATNHDDVDYEMVRSNAPLIVDTRGVYVGNFANVVRA